MVSKNRFTVVKVDGKWKIKQLERLDQKGTVDGKPIPQ
jgi:hypothetical protein